MLNVRYGRYPQQSAYTSHCWCTCLVLVYTAADWFDSFIVPRYWRMNQSINQSINQSVFRSTYLKAFAIDLWVLWVRGTMLGDWRSESWHSQLVLPLLIFNSFCLWASEEGRQTAIERQNFVVLSAAPSHFQFRLFYRPAVFSLMACTLCPFSFSIPFVLQAGRLLIDCWFENRKLFVLQASSHWWHVPHAPTHLRAENRVFYRQAVFSFILLELEAISKLFSSVSVSVSLELTEIAFDRRAICFSNRT